MKNLVKNDIFSIALYFFFELIVATESMDNDERQYWFDIMPSMTDAQIDRLYDILDTEKRKLQELAQWKTSHWMARTPSERRKEESCSCKSRGQSNRGESWWNTRNARWSIEISLQKISPNWERFFNHLLLIHLLSF